MIGAIGGTIHMFYEGDAAVIPVYLLIVREMSYFHSKVYVAHRYETIGTRMNATESVSDSLLTKTNSLATLLDK